MLYGDPVYRVDVIGRTGDPASAFNAWEIQTFMGRPAAAEQGNGKQPGEGDLAKWLKANQTTVLASAAGLLVLAVVMKRR